MSSELFVPLGRVSRRVKNLMRFGLACGVAYIVLIACKPFPLNTMYYGFHGRGCGANDAAGVPRTILHGGCAVRFLRTCPSQSG